MVDVEFVVFKEDDAKLKEEEDAEEAEEEGEGARVVMIC